MSRQTIISSILSLITGLLLMGIATFNSQDKILMMEDASKYNFETTVEQFEQAVDEAGWSIINTHDMQQMILRHGHEVNSVKIFEVCSARYSAELLKLDDERIISPLMPCRVAIYEKSDGNTYIARMDNEEFARPFGGVIEEVMTTATRDVEEIIARITD